MRQHGTSSLSSPHHFCSKFNDVNYFKTVILRRRFILHKETNLQKKLHTYFTKSIYTYNGDAIHNIHAGSLRTTSYRSL